VNVLVIDPTSNIATFQVQSDAYLQGTSNYNNTMLRVEMNKRTSYLKFNVSNIVGQITKATLILTEGGDVGNGTLEIYSASHNNWTETTLSASNAPVTTALITRFQGSISGAQKVSLDVTSWINQLGTYTLVLKMSEGNDVAFSSKEGNNPPQLIIESELPINQAPVISAGADIELPFPNHSTTLNGEVSDDGLPYGSTLSSWTKVEGPGDVDFSDSTSSSTTASFSEIGIYTLKLSADDGELSSEYSIQVTVLPENISVTKFVLVDADRDLDVKILQDGDSINTAIYGANLNIRAEVEGPVESVRFQLNNNIKLENVAPYAIFGDTSGDYKAWPNPIGDHAILATPFYADKAQGGAGQSNSLQLAVTTASLPYQSVVQFLLMNAVTNKEIRPLYHGARISLSHDGNDLSVVAKVGDGVESLVFDLDNQIGIQTENVPPYALSGDKSGDFYSWTPSVGSHTLTATPYSADKASGAMGVPLQIEFIVTE
jgi:hypothetical protein